jgi:hypothetical protein
MGLLAAIIIGLGLAIGLIAFAFNPSYQAELEGLAGQREASEKTIAEWDAAFATFEAARSLNSMLKETWRGT